MHPRDDFVVLLVCVTIRCILHPQSTVNDPTPTLSYEPSLRGCVDTSEGEGDRYQEKSCSKVNVVMGKRRKKKQLSKTCLVKKQHHIEGVCI